MYTITDEELNTSGQLDQDARYTIRDNNGNVVYDNVKIELKTPVSVEGTPINKVTLEGIQNDLMNETKLVVAEYTTTSDVSEIEITGLDLESDGSFYEIIFAGRTNASSNYQVFLQINDITTGYRTMTDSGSTVADSNGFILGSFRNLGSQSIMYITQENGRYLAHTLQVYSGSSNNVSLNNRYGGMLTSNENLTKITIYEDASHNIASGTKIKVVKRR